MIKKTGIIFSMLLIMNACKNPQNASEAKFSTNDEISLQSKTEPTLDSETNLSLDNGKKWSANKETTDGVNALTNAVQTFQKSAQVEDYQILGVKLQNIFKGIFEKCTMTGEEHEQLHKFLIPIHKELLILEKEVLEDSQESLERLKNKLHLYSEYFE